MRSDFIYCAGWTADSVDGKTAPASTAGPPRRGQVLRLHFPRLWNGFAGGRRKTAAAICREFRAAGGPRTTLDFTFGDERSKLSAAGLNVGAAYDTIALLSSSTASAYYLFGLPGYRLGTDDVGIHWKVGYAAADGNQRFRAAIRDRTLSVSIRNIG